MTASTPPGRLIGSGRAADVYELGPNRVLRRYRVAAEVSTQLREQHADLVHAEARLMRHLRSLGFPVPQVYDADGTDMVMERVVGTDMLTDLGKRPWRAWRQANLLAQIHDRLHAIEAPEWLPRPFGEGDQVMHLDLHPGNVMLTADGPVVIDWSNGAAGPPGADVAMASLIMRTSEVNDLPMGVRLVAGFVRDSVVRRFERSVTADPGPYLVKVARHRLTDRNTRPSEAALLQRIIDTGRD
jgi:tRNA A-37 threonylcarbamoyl transferase component Bud32